MSLILSNPPDPPDCRRTNWAKFQTDFEDQIPFHLEMCNGTAVDTCVVNFSGAILKGAAATTPKCRPRDNTRFPIPPGIQDEIGLKNRLRRQ